MYLVDIKLEREMGGYQHNALLNSVRNRCVCVDQKRWAVQM